MNQIEKMCRDHFNEVVLIYLHGGIGRLIGYGEDEEDCYLIVQFPNNEKKDIQWVTAVGGYIFLRPLKGQNEVIPKNPAFEGEVWDDYFRLDYSLTINNCKPSSEFITEIEGKENG